MDFRRSWRKQRILGDGKTWRGFFGGSIAGMLIGLVELFVSDPFSEDHFGFGDFPVAIPIIIALSFGSMLGDSGGAFIKRRLGISRGDKAVLLDQYDFIIGALLVMLAINPGWIGGTLIIEGAWMGFVFFLIMVPLIHRAINIAGYKLGKKDVPW